MLNFLINIKPQKKPQEMYEIHNVTAGCKWLPDQDNCLHLGEFGSAEEARVQACRLFIFPQICHACCGSAAVVPIMRPRTDDVKTVSPNDSALLAQRE